MGDAFMDYFLANGILLEPFGSSGKHGNLLIRNGHIEIVSDGNPPPSAEWIDCSDCMITSGLIDTHFHANQFADSLGANADVVCIPNGVTTAIDAGSCGVSNIGGLLRFNISRYTTDVRALVNVVSSGQLYGTPYEETDDPEYFEASEICRLFQEYPDELKGIKIRYHANCTKGFGLRPLQKTVEIASRVEDIGLKCPVVVHLGQLEEPLTLQDVLETLRPGDVVAHVFQNSGETLLSREHRVQRCFFEAKERGIQFDLAHGRFNFTFENITQALKEGFCPDMLGSDVGAGNCYIRPAFSLMSTMTMMYALGMPLEKIIRAVTATPKEVYDLGTAGKGLKEELSADLSVFRLVKGKITFVDRMKEKLTAKECFMPMMTIKNGKVIYRQSIF